MNRHLRLPALSVCRHAALRGWPVTLALLVAFGVVYASAHAVGLQPGSTAWAEAVAAPARPSSRWFVALFAHASPLHLGLNAFVTVGAVGAAEARWGSLRTAAVLVLATLLWLPLAWVLAPAGTYMVGASGILAAMAPVAFLVRPSRTWTLDRFDGATRQPTLVLNGIVVVLLVAWVAIALAFGSIGAAPGEHPAFHAGHAAGGVVGVVVAAALLASE